ncbi:MAG: hypothetical protein ACYCYR_02155 [Desulfobulbaceae bacterium]
MKSITLDNLHEPRNERFGEQPKTLRIRQGDFNRSPGGPASVSPF